MTKWIPILSAGGSKPIHLALVDTLAAAIRATTLPPGARLPAQREPATVAAALKQAPEIELL